MKKFILVILLICFCLFGFIGNILALSPPTSIPVAVPFTQGGYTYTDYFFATQSLIPSSQVTDCSEYRIRYYTSGSNRPYFGLAYPNKLFLDWGGYASHPVIQYIAVRSGNNCVFTTPYAPSTNANTGVFNYTAYPISSVIFLASRDILYGGSHDFGSLYCNLGNMINGGVVYAGNGGSGPHYTLSVVAEPEAGGNIKVNNVLCTDYPCQSSIAIGSTPVLEAVPSTNYAFDHWEWECDCNGTNTSTTNPMNLTMNDDLIVEGVFKPKFSFPLSGYTKTSVPISAVMDHSLEGGFYSADGRDGIVEAFNGEIGNEQYGVKITDGVRGYKQQSGNDFLSGYTYPDPDNEYLFYDEHPGFDFAVSAGTDVLAPFNGKLYWATTDAVNGNPGTFGTFYIDHENGYTTWFLHCSNLTQAVIDEIQQNGYAEVEKGDHIAESGNTGTTGAHLHFEVRKDGVDDANVIDPYKEGLWE